MYTSALAILNAYISSCTFLSICLFWTIINNFAFVQSEEGTCVFIQHSNLNSVGLWLKSLWKPCTPAASQAFWELRFQFQPSPSLRHICFHNGWTCLCFFKCQNSSLFPGFLVGVEKYGHSPTPDCNEYLNYDFLGHGGNPAMFVTVNLSLGNIAGLWRNVPVCIFSLMHY